MAIKDKIILFDLDGTLTRNDACVSSFSATKIKELVNQGYHISFNTGRQWVSSKESYEACGLKDICVLGNGTVIYDPSKDEELFKKPLDEKFIFDLVDNEEFINLIKEVFGEHGITTYSFKGNHLPKNVIVGNFHETLDCKLTSLVVLTYNKDDATRVKEIVEATDSRYTYRSWGTLGEIYNKDFTKMDGAKVLLDKLGKTFDDVVFFGDATNDVEMLKASKYGICMKNGNDLAKSASDFITDYTNDEDGAVKFLLKIIDENLI